MKRLLVWMAFVLILVILGVILVISGFGVFGGHLIGWPIGLFAVGLLLDRLGVGGSRGRYHSLFIDED